MRVVRRERKKREKVLRVGDYTVVVECTDFDCTVRVGGREWRLRGVFEEACIRVSETEDICLSYDDIYS